MIQWYENVKSFDCFYIAYGKLLALIDDDSTAPIEERRCFTAIFLVNIESVVHHE